MKKTISFKDIDIIFFWREKLGKNLSGHVIKKYDYINIINFDEVISEMEINIKDLPSFKKNLLILIVQRIQNHLMI